MVLFVPSPIGSLSSSGCPGSLVLRFPLVHRTPLFHGSSLVLVPLVPLVPVVPLFHFALMVSSVSIIHCFCIVHAFFVFKLTFERLVDDDASHAHFCILARVHQVIDSFNVCSYGTHDAAHNFVETIAKHLLNICFSISKLCLVQSRENTMHCAWTRLHQHLIGRKSLVFRRTNN